MSIIISKKGQVAQKLDKSNFEAEDYLQNYIHKNPESIPVYEIEKNKKLFVVKREFATNSGPIDALAVDKDGDIYIVETKLYKNPDKRTVVAQALDYGSALWRHLNDFNEFIETLNQECQKNFKSTFQEKLIDFFNLNEEQVEMQLESMKKNLNDGNLKFVILMDSIDDRLKDLIVYVNQNSQFDIYAVQMEYYKFNDYEIMIPKIFGVEVKKNIKGVKAGVRKKWNEQDFIAQVKERLGLDSKKVIELYHFLKEKADKINWGTGNLNGSFAPVFFKINKNIAIFSFFSNGDLMIKFSWVKDTLGEEKLNEYIKVFADRIEEKTSIDISRNELLQKEVRISSEDFLENYKAVSDAIKETIDL